MPAGRSRIYAPRVKGDLDLGLEPSRIDGAGNKLWARMDTPGGKLPGGSDQNIYVASATPNYRLGTRRVQDSRTFHYARLATTTRTGGIYGSTGYGGITQGLGVFSVAIPSGALTIVTATLGATSVTISSPTLTVDQYAGGLLTIYESGQPLCIMGIISNTATVIYLDGTLPGTYSAGSNANAQVIAGPWGYEVIIPGLSCSAGGAFDFCAGIFNSPLDEDGNIAAPADYVWIQTWGLCNVWACGTYEGGLGAERDVYMMGDGAAQINLAVADANRLGYQKIGTLYPGTGPTGETVAEHPGPIGGNDTTLMNHIVFLQIAP